MDTNASCLNRIDTRGSGRGGGEASIPFFKGADGFIAAISLPLHSTRSTTTEPNLQIYHNFTPNIYTLGPRVLACFSNKPASYINCVWNSKTWDELYLHN